MHHLGRRIVTLTLPVLLAISAIDVATAGAGQVGAIKDGWLVMKVHSEMLDEAVLSGSDIDVDVKDGVITLQGTVPSAAARARALEVARKNDGVKRVIDRLTVGAPQGRSTAGTMAKAEDKVERGADKAMDKSASAAKTTGRAIDDGWIKSKIYAQSRTTS